jgi:hypothetical protein
VVSDFEIISSVFAPPNPQQTMSAGRTAVVATALVFVIVAFHTFYLSYLESPLRYEGLPWFYKNAGPPSSTSHNGTEYLIGVGKADITG